DRCAFLKCSARASGQWRLRNFGAARASVKAPCFHCETMPRFKLTIEYDGGPFAGWQRQENGLSVQGTIEAALQGVCGRAVSICGAGRTDAGVHALGQVAHVDLAKDWPLDVLRDGLNAHLCPHPIAILAAELVPAAFDARFSAKRRHYLYRIVDRRAP